jgi:hypothetical protein
LSVVIGRVGVYVERARPETGRFMLTSAVLVANLALALTPAVIGILALLGVVR